MDDPTWDALTVRYPRVQWRREGDLYRGVSGSIHLRVWQEEGGESAGLPDDPWWADAWTGDDAPADGVGGYPSAVRALDRIAMMRPQYRAALHAAPEVADSPSVVIPAGQSKNQPVGPEHGDFSRSHIPQRTPFPAMMLGCLTVPFVLAWEVAYSWRWHLLLGTLVLGFSAIFLGFWSGGVQW